MGYAIAALACTLGSAKADPVTSVDVPADATAASQTKPDGTDSNANATLLGDMGGLRPALNNHGISLSIQEISEYLGNVQGGVHQGFQYDGLTTATMQMDTQRAFGWSGGTFNVSALQIHGTNLSADNLSTLQTASGIQADRATRLWELWYDQKFLADDRMDVKVGQQSLDQEFIVSTNSQYFVNTMMGWPMVPSADMPGGGPAYPLSALGARVAVRPTDGITVLAGVFGATPVSNPSGDPQRQNRSGTSFPLGRGTMSIMEMQFASPVGDSKAEPGKLSSLGGTYRIGAWYNTQQFADQRFDNGGLSLSDPSSSGKALQHHGDYGWYAVADQFIWRDQRDANRAISLFGRLMGTPQKDRNVVDASLNAGVVFHAPFKYRSADTFGIGVGYAHVSSQAAALDSDTNAFNGTFAPIRSSEKFIELTYQYQATPWLVVQPDIQYVFNPGAGLVDPNNSGQRIKNELVLGVRTTISF